MTPDAFNDFMQMEGLIELIRIAGDFITALVEMDMYDYASTVKNMQDDFTESLNSLNREP